MEWRRFQCQTVLFAGYGRDILVQKKHLIGKAQVLSDGASNACTAEDRDLGSSAVY
jgi:hypothetical protein